MKKYTIQFMRLSLALSFLVAGINSFSQDVVVASAVKPVVKEEKLITEGDVQEENAKEEEEGKFSVSGYLDTYYFTNFNRPASRDNMGQSGVGRGFDRRVDDFQLGMVQTVFKYSNRKSEMVADLAYGPSAQYGNYGNILVTGPNYGYRIGNDVYSAVIIKQAYFKYNATEKLSFTAGQFATPIGYEYIDAPLNFHYSINHTFNSGIPFYHIGVKSAYEVSDKVSLMLGAVNGFDYIHDNNRAVGLLAQVSLAPAENLSMYFNFFSSNESTADSLGNTPVGNFTVYDLNGGYQATEKLFIGYWFLYGSQYGTLGSPGTFIPADGNVDEKKSWYGANIYFTYAFSDVFSLGFRGEHFDNKEGARGLRNVDSSGQVLGASCNTGTLTGNFTLADGHLLLKPELRIDVFNKLTGIGNESSQQFMDSEGLYTKNGQTTLGMAAIYKF